MNVISALHNPYFNPEYYLFIFVDQRLKCANFDHGNKHSYNPPYNGDHSYSCIDIYNRISNFEELQFCIWLAYLGCFVHR